MSKLKELYKCSLKKWEEVKDIFDDFWHFVHQNCAFCEDADMKKDGYVCGVCRIDRAICGSGTSQFHKVSDKMYELDVEINKLVAELRWMVGDE